MMFPCGPTRNNSILLTLNLLGEPVKGSAKPERPAPKPSLKSILGALGALAFFRFVYWGQH
jgi:hypothetical protein